MNDGYISREEVLNLIDIAFENGAFDGRYAYENLIDAVQNLIHPLETDLISRKSALEILDDYTEDIESGNFGAYTKARISMLKLPSVEPERKKGKWVEYERVEETYQGYLVSNYECDQCHEWVRDQSNYCPNCGAKMVEPQESEVDG